MRFTSAILPPYLRRTKAIDELVPWLYLKGISTGDFPDALQALLGPGVEGLSATNICRLKRVWEDEWKAWSRRDLTDKTYVYVWADGIHFNIRLGDAADKKQCILVLMGATADGTKELIGITDGYRESEQSWAELLVGLQSRGLAISPKVAAADGALGFWAASRKLWPDTRDQRCWVHKTANVLNKLPKSLLRHRRTKGSGSRTACLTMVFKLARAAEKLWRRLNGSALLPDVIRGVRFIDGIKEIAA
ncbi:MAG: hypothetical protein GY838_03995 [bacterium]|nr:hypothetical protein [bacterium]